MTPLYTQNIIVGIKLLEDYANDDTVIIVNCTKETIVFRNLDMLDNDIIKELIKHQWIVYTGKSYNGRTLSSAECKILVSQFA